MKTLFNKIAESRISDAIFVLLSVILLINPKPLFAERVMDKSAKSRPMWINETPRGMVFDYYLGIATSSTSLEDAKDKAIVDAIGSFALKSEFSMEGTIIANETEVNDILYNSITQEIKLHSKSQIIMGLEKEEDYWEIIERGLQTNYRYWVLMKYPKAYHPGKVFPTHESSYGKMPILKSVLVPGWGQVAKGESPKGMRFLSGIAVLASSGFIAINISRGYQDDAENAHNTAWVDYYNQKSTQYFYLGMASFILAGALYGYNVFDAVSAQGAKMYADECHRFRICYQAHEKCPLGFSYRFNRE